MIDICTVVFKEELPILKLQAQSLDQYARNIGIRNIYVVINDDIEIAKDIDFEWYGELADNVALIPQGVFGADLSTNGWLSQQLLKLLIASMSHNVWTMTLDAKTILVQNLNISDLIDSLGRANVGVCPIQPVFEPSKKIAEEIWEVQLDSQIGPAGVPFLFHNATVKSMMADTFWRTGETFPNWFQKQGMLTEFICYSAYVKHMFNGFEKFYNTQSNIHPVNLCHSEYDIWDQKMQDMLRDDTTTVSIHRNAWSKATEEQRDQYRKILCQRGISWGEELK